MYNIAADGTLFKTAQEIRENATGAAIRYCGLDTVFHIAYNRKGWVTAASESGLIIQGWAGNFCAA